MGVRCRAHTAAVCVHMLLSCQLTLSVTSRLYLRGGGECRARGACSPRIAGAPVRSLTGGRRASSSALTPRSPRLLLSSQRICLLQKGTRASDRTEECAICLDPCGSGVVSTMPCTHGFHAAACLMERGLSASRKLAPSAAWSCTDSISCCRRRVLEYISSYCVKWTATKQHGKHRPRRTKQK